MTRVLCNAPREPNATRTKIEIRKCQNRDAIYDVSMCDVSLVLPLLRSTNKFIVWHVNGCVRAKKLQRSVKKILNEATE